MMISSVRDTMLPYILPAIANSFGWSFYYFIFNGRFWLAKNDPSKYRDIYAINDIFEYYQKFVGDYEEVMRGWGYCVPEVTVDAIEKYGGVADR